MKPLACFVLYFLLLAGAFADPVFEIAKIYLPVRTRYAEHNSIRTRYTIYQRRHISSQ